MRQATKKNIVVICGSLLLLLLAHYAALLYRVQPAVSLWFPPSGVAIALTLWFGPIEILLTWLASFICSPLWGNDGWARFASITDASEPLIAWFLYYRCCKGSPALNKLQHVVTFLICAPLLACFTSAMTGMLVLVAFNKIPYVGFWRNIPYWWLGNAIGTMAIAPAALLLFTPFLQKRGWLAQSSSAVPFYPPIPSVTKRQWIEISLLLVSLVCMGWLTVEATKVSIFLTLQLSLLNFIPVFWALTRFGARGGVITASFSVIVSLLIYLLVYPNALHLPQFPVNPELLHTHKLSLLLQCAIALVTGTAISERAHTQVMLAVEKVRSAEYQARAELSDQFLQLNRLLIETNEELAESENRYRYLAESIPQLVWTATPDGVLLDANQRWINFTGLTLALAQTSGWQAIVHPDDISTLEQQWAAAQQSGWHYQAEGRLRRADGIYRWHLHQATPLKDESNQVIKWFGTATDIEDQKQLEQQRDRSLLQEQAAREAAERANRIKDEFLAVLSHELRSPLNPILGWSQLLQTRKFDAAKTAEALATIERNARLQSELIEDLLDVSRILRGKLSLNVTPVNLRSTIQAAMETVRLAAAAKSMELTLEIIEPAPNSAFNFFVIGDEARLQQIFWNLFSNGVKFTPAGGQVHIRLSLADHQVDPDISAADPQERSPHSANRLDSASQQNYSLPIPSSPPHPPHPTPVRLTLSAEAHTPHPTPHPPIPYALIQVQDTGKGISPSFLPYVFDYFRQADASTTRQFGGLGLGLAIVRHLVELHGGTIQAGSAGEEQGATFTIQLPLLTLEKKPDDNADRLDSTLTLNQVKILLVDDETDAREFVVFLLQQYGAQVTAAASAANALATLAQCQPDVIISDIGMPEQDGYRLIHQIRALPADQGGQIPAIALTAYAGERDQQQALTAGFQTHIAKPVDAATLVVAISAIVQQKIANNYL